MSIEHKSSKDIDNGKILNIAKRVIKSEIDGLVHLEESINHDFIRLVNMIQAIKGRVITTGMGKSGIVARKIAATLASTGTPSHFVHPAEASHGDLGMITEDDLVLLLSNSGETQELNSLINYCKRFAIPLVGMIRNPKSNLFNIADLVILLPDTEEATLVKAPTTSTTMTMALGDALAITLLELKGFTEEDFFNFHPSGTLGKRLIKVGDLMHVGGEIPLAHMNDLMSSVIPNMTEKSLGVIGLTNDVGELVGIITDGDLRRNIKPDLLEKKAKDIMSKNPKTIPDSHLAVEAMKILNSKRITCLFVVDEYSKPIGIIQFHDLLKAGIF